MLETIIYSLKTNNGYLSGEELSRLLNISRAGIWKYIQELRKEGYDIQAIPHLGYKLISCPDKLLPYEIKHHLNTKIIGRDIRYFDSISSTMDKAFELGTQGAQEGVVVCSETQTKGRGRLGRSWVSAKSKGIYMSILLRPKLVPSEVSQLTLLSAVAVSEAIKNVCGLNCSIKWPNDLMINEKKLVGILTELRAEIDQVKFVVVGIGVNVNTALNHLPETATSIKNELGKSFSRIVLIQEILRLMEKWYFDFERQGFLPVAERWRKLSLTLGQRVRVVEPKGFIEGNAVDIDKDGGLLIREDSGVIVKKMAGEVVQLQ